MSPRRSLISGLLLGSCALSCDSMLLISHSISFSALGLPSSTLLATLSTLDTEERYFLAGGLCACISHTLATPIDVVKTRQQTRPDYRDTSLLEGLGRVVADEGPAALFTGVGPTAVGYGLEGVWTGVLERRNRDGVFLHLGRARGVGRRLWSVQ